MTDDSWGDLVEVLRNTGIEFDAGLTDAEVATAEGRFGFRFPPDLKAFLQTALPVGVRFPNWRSGGESSLRDWLDLPRRGILFDIEHNGFWLEEWGPRPQTLDEANRIANSLIDAAPRLIPIFIHRMMPADPHLPGNPVFSVHQTDIIYYGADLRHYFGHEFMAGTGGAVWPPAESIRRIEFWDIDRFQEVRWAGGSCAFDNSAGQLP